MIQCTDTKLVVDDDNGPKPGEYPGCWSGYSVVFPDSTGRMFESITGSGVRGFNVPVIVVVDNFGNVVIDR